MANFSPFNGLSCVLPEIQAITWAQEKNFTGIKHEARGKYQKEDMFVLFIHCAKLRYCCSGTLTILIMDCLHRISVSIAGIWISGISDL